MLIFSFRIEMFWKLVFFENSFWLSHPAIIKLAKLGLVRLGSTRLAWFDTWITLIHLIQSWKVSLTLFRSHLAFYMLYVKTKVDFQPIAFVVCGLVNSKPCSGSLVQGLKYLISNNSNWSPSYCICSNISETEVDLESIENSFPASLNVVVGDVTREQNWNDFFARSNLDQVGWIV